MCCHLNPINCLHRSCLQRKLPILERCLYPRVKGFEATLKGAGPLLDAVYDVTLAFSGAPPSIYEVRFSPLSFKFNH